MSANIANIPAVLISYSVSVLSNSRQDPAITKGVKELHKLTGKSGKWIKYKLPEEALEQVRKAATRGRSNHYALTLPWEEGQRLLPLSARGAYDAQIEKDRTFFNACVEDFITNYPDWVDVAKEMHNGTFAPSDYPGLEAYPGTKPSGVSAEDWTAQVAAMKLSEGYAVRLREEFSLTVTPSPIPQASHFNATMRGMYGDALEQANQSRIDAAVKAVWDRLLEPVAHMVERLSDPGKVYRDSLVDNVREILQLLPQLNITGDAKLVAAAEQIRTKLAALNPDALRQSTVLRAQVTGAAKSILATFGQMGSRKLA